MSRVLSEGLCSGWIPAAAGRATNTLFAYLDQGKGSYILQTVATGIFSLGYFARRLWRRLSSPWGRKDD